MQDNQDLLSLLTERHCRLLELVANGRTTSKGLATETGMTAGSIDTILYEAAKILGARDRKEAAKRYQELKENSQRPSQLRISPLPDSTEVKPTHEASAVWRWAIAVSDFMRGPPLGGEEHSLRWDQITLQILRVAAITMVSITALVLLVLGFFKTFS